MNDTTTRGRARRFTGIAAGLVALLAGVAVAYFLTANDFGGNSATGGTLTVTSSLDSDPLNYDGDPGLYPTSETSPSNTKSDTFSITNNNPVQVTYELTATCASQAAGQAGRDAGATPCTPEELAQYEDLFIKIQDPAGSPDYGPIDESDATLDEVCNPAEDALSLCEDAPAQNVYYQGYLSDLVGSAVVQIPAGQPKTFEAVIWLVNDPNAEQTQGVTTPFVLTVSAKTPA